MLSTLITMKRNFSSLQDEPNYMERNKTIQPTNENGNEILDENEIDQRML